LDVLFDFLTIKAEYAERESMKPPILMTLCAVQLILAAAVQARSVDHAFETGKRSPWHCFIAVAGTEQDQSETDESEQQAEDEEPDCD
jgi:hypothetical protein